MSGIRSIQPRLSLCILIIVICSVAAKMPWEFDKSDDPLSKYDDSWPKPPSASAYSPASADRSKRDRDWPYSLNSMLRSPKPRSPYMSHNWYRPSVSRYPSIYDHNLLGYPTRPTFPGYAPWMRPGGYSSRLPRPRPSMGLTPLPGYAPWMRPGGYSNRLPRPRPSMGLTPLTGFLGSSGSGSLIGATNRLSRAVERIANVLERR